MEILERSIAPWIGRTTRIVLMLVILTTGALAASLTIEALEERQAAVAVTDMRLAVIASLDVDAESAPTTAERERLEASIDVLSGPREQALRALAAEDRLFANRELDMVLMHARSMIGGAVMGSMTHSLIVHEDLELLLREGSVSAAADAVSSERWALVFGIASMASIGLLSANLLIARSRRDRRRARDAAFGAAALRLGALLDESADAIAIRDRDGVFSYRSAQFDRLFDADEVTNVEDLLALIDAEQRDEVRAIIAKLSDEESSFDVAIDGAEGADRREFKVRVSDLSADPVVAGHLLSLRETTADNASRRELEALVLTDQLTSLANRRALMQTLSGSYTESCSLMMMDLDGFKRTNDAHGHHAGDELLRAVATRLRSVIGDGDGLFRLGGDEFALLVATQDDVELQTLAQQLIGQFETPVLLKTGFEEVRISIGIAKCDGQPTRLPLLRRADVALYAAKSHGGNRYEMLRPELEDRSARQSSISSRLHSVCLDDEFDLVFQPIVDATTGTTSYVEALVRWTSPTLGAVYPDEFIPMAESSGRIVEIGLWVLDQALTSFCAWRETGAADNVTLTVNVSPRQLEEDAFVVETLRLLAKHRVHTGDLVLEVTESALVKPDSGMVDRLERLREAGCLVACDDFGAGYSNLGQLMTLPLDIIKVDRQLLLQLSDMRELTGDHGRSCQVMGAIVTIGMAMNAKLVAEGVETELQRRTLQASGVHFLQGYLFSQPVADAAIAEMLVQQQPAPVLEISI